MRSRFRRNRPSALAGLIVVGLVTILSLLWWRADVNRCDCNFCPDGFCLYAERIHAALIRNRSDSLPRLEQFGRDFTHAHSPLGPVIQSLIMLPGPSPVLAFMIVSMGATIASWVAIRRTIMGEWEAGPRVVALLFVGFFCNPIVIQAFARPSADAIGMACAVWALLSLVDHLRQRDGASAARLGAFQLLGLFSRVSFIPMLAMPALAELARGRSSAERRRATLVAGVLFGALPGALFLGITRALGIEHLAEAWRWAHTPAYTAFYTVRDFLLGIGLAGSIYLLLAMAGVRLGGWQNPAWQVHALWTGLYLAFLVNGRGALWVRYFLPIVPSSLVVATPALLRLSRRRIFVVWALVGAASIWGLAWVRPLVGDARQSLALLAHDLEGIGDLRSGAVRRNLGRRLREPITLTASQANSDVSLALDGRLDTFWATTGPQAPGIELTLDLGSARMVRSVILFAEPSTQLRRYIVHGSLDGVGWATLRSGDGFREIRGFLAEQSGAILRLPGERVRYLRIQTTSWNRGPWVVREIEVRVARRPRQGGRRE